MAATTMQLEFEQAMTDFKTMFPDMDVEVIEAILRSNKGAVDATIDQLLAMSTDNQNEKLRHEMDHSRGGGGGGGNKRASTNSHKLSSSPINAPQPSSAAEIRSRPVVDANSLLSISPAPLVSFGSPASPSNGGASPKRQYNHRGGGGGGAITNGSSRWKPPMLSPLPLSFLRINYNCGAGGSRGGASATGDHELPDEQFALMLQNEEFMNELRWNQEFMLALEKEQQGQKGKGDDEAVFRDRVRNMGKMSRKKFQQLAKKFTWQKNKKIGAVRHPDSLLLQEEHSDDDEPRRGGSRK